MRSQTLPCVVSLCVGLCLLPYTVWCTQGESEFYQSRLNPPKQPIGTCLTMQGCWQKLRAQMGMPRKLVITSTHHIIQVECPVELLVEHLAEPVGHLEEPVGHLVEPVEHLVELVERPGEPGEGLGEPGEGRPA